MPLLLNQPWAGAGTTTPRLRGSHSRGVWRSGSQGPQAARDGPLQLWRVFASPPRRCRTCSLRLTTSHGLPEAEPRDPAATPSPFLSPSHNPAPSTGPDAVAQRAGLTLWAATSPVKPAPRAHQPHARLSSVPALLLPVPALAQALPPRGFSLKRMTVGWGWGCWMLPYRMEQEC